MTLTATLWFGGLLRRLYIAFWNGNNPRLVLENDRIKNKSLSTTIVKGIASTGLVTIRGERYICTTTNCIWFYIYLKKRRNVRCFNHSLKCFKFFNIQTISLTSRKWKSIFLLFNTWRLDLRSRRVFWNINCYCI